MNPFKNHFKQILTEAPHCTNVVCPNCSQKFDLDMQIELWNLPLDEKTRLIMDYFKYDLITTDCPKCRIELIYDNLKKKTYNYYHIIQTLPAHIQRYLKEVKRFSSEYDIKYEIEESLRFKTFSDTLDKNNK